MYKQNVKGHLEKKLIVTAYFKCESYCLVQIDALIQKTSPVLLTHCVKTIFAFEIKD